MHFNPCLNLTLLYEQYTRLVLLTVEVVAAMRLPCTRNGGVLAETNIRAPSGYSFAFGNEGEFIGIFPFPPFLVLGL